MIGGRSPLLDITQRQAEALERDLNRGKGQGTRGEDFRVFVGMRYWHPFIKDTLKEIVSLKAERIVVLVMAPHYSTLSTGNYIKAVNDAITELLPISPPYIRGSERGLNISFINNWHTHPLFLEAITEKIKKGVSNFSSLISSPPRGEGQGEGVQVIFSAHSLPEKDDTYVKQLNETIDGVIKLTGDIPWHLGFQSKGMSPGEWLEPAVDSILERLSKEGKKYILIVPIGFVSDHIETLYDINIVYKKMAESLGMIFYRTESLNDSPKFIESLSDIVRGHLQQLI